MGSASATNTAPTATRSRSPVRIRSYPISGGSLPYLASTIQICQIDRSFIYRDLRLELSGQLTLAKANNTAANTLPGDGCAVIRQVTLKGDGQPILTWTGEALKMRTVKCDGVFPLNPVAAASRLAAGAGANDNPSFYETLILNFEDSGIQKPMLGCFDATQFNTCWIEVQWGTFTSINANATGFTVAPTIIVSGTVLLDRPIGRSGKPILFTPTRVEILNTLQSAAGQFNIPLTVGPNRWFRGILINVKDTNNVNDTPGILTNIQLNSTGINYLNMSANLVADQNARRIGPPIGVASTFASAGSLPAAWYYLDMLMERPGYLSEALNSAALSALFLTLNVSGACNVNLYQDLFTPATQT